MAVRKANSDDTSKPVDNAKDEEPVGERTPHVLRKVDGTPWHDKGFKLYLPEGVSDEEKAAAWNADGELPPEGGIEYYPVPEQF
ncbi:MAG: hypothetical protein JWO11_3493 [Nocardioides sp.]|nr:hypothetical protein [Nocardioides sp.]